MKANWQLQSGTVLDYCFYCVQQDNLRVDNPRLARRRDNLCVCGRQATLAHNRVRTLIGSQAEKEIKH